MAGKAERDSRPGTFGGRALPFGAWGAVLLVFAAACGLLGAAFPAWKPVYDFLVVVLGSFGGALLSIAVSGIWWNEVTRNETKAMLADAVAGTFEQDPEFVAEYFQPKKVLGFLRNNLEARTKDAQLARAVADDLLGPFIREEKPTRIRTSQRYIVKLEYCEPGTGSAEDSAFPVWRVVENLRFDERLQPDYRERPLLGLQEKSIVAAFVFCESALGPWFARPDCMYRSVAYMPEDLMGAKDAEARQRWAESHLGCALQLDGVDLPLEKVVDVRAARREEWSVTFVLQADVSRIDRIRDGAEPKAEGGFAQVRIAIQGMMTWSPRRYDYTAYLVYPTLDPEIEFQIEGEEVDQLECATFYNVGTDPDDVKVDSLDGSDRTKHVRIRLASQRWVFPRSGAVFSWSMREAGVLAAAPPAAGDPDDDGLRKVPA